MKALDTLLSRYTHIKAPEKTVRDAFIRAVDGVVGVSVGPDRVRIKNKTATLDVPSIIKHEIHMNKTEILERVAKELNDKYALTAIY